MQTMKFGEVTISRVIEIDRSSFPTASMLPRSSADVIAGHHRWLKPHFFDERTGDLASRIQTYVVKTPRHTILIDTGVGNDKARTLAPAWNMRTGGSYLDDLAAVGVTPEQVDFVVCTHLHVDHVGWNTRLENGKWVPTFPNAKYVMSRTDHDHWEALAKKPDTEAYQVNTYNDSVLPIVEAKKAEFVSGDHAMCGCLTLKPAPGHTPGQIRVDLDSRGKRAIFAGDALHNPVQVPLWKWNSCFCEDRDLARKSRHTLLADCVEQGALLMPAHFAPPHAAYVKDKGDRFELDWDWDNARGR
jgi:glyoxylase-like metal-dependent hydrolase (beta-lactamase superfamily II)